MCVLHVKAVWLSQGCSSWSLSLHNRGLGLSIWPSVCICVCLHLCVCVIHCFCNVPNPFFIPLWKSYRIMLILPFTSRGKLDCHLISYRLWLILLFFFFVSPAASSISSESPPVSSPATNHSSPVSTPKRGPLGPGPVLVPPAGHTVPNTPPVVTIAPTKTSNGLWRSEGRQVNISSVWPLVYVHG